MSLPGCRLKYSRHKSLHSVWRVRYTLPQCCLWYPKCHCRDWYGRPQQWPQWCPPCRWDSPGLVLQVVCSPCCTGLPPRAGSRRVLCRLTDCQIPAAAQKQRIEHHYIHNVLLATIEIEIENILKLGLKNVLSCMLYCLIATYLVFILPRNPYLSPGEQTVCSYKF